MSELVDLTGPIKNGMWHYPEPFTKPRIEKIKGEVSWKSTWDFFGENIRMSSLTGTYFETSAHLFPEDPTVDQIPVSEFVREALIIKVPKDRKELVKLSEAKSYLSEEREEVKEGDSVLIATGWDKYWKEGRFLDSPYFQDDLVEWLVDRGISLLGGDVPKSDNAEDPQGVVPTLFKNDVLFLCNLVNLIDIPASRVKLYVFPLNLQNACASPCRVACEFDEGGRNESVGGN